MSKSTTKYLSTDTHDCEDCRQSTAFLQLLEAGISVKDIFDAIQQYHDGLTLIRNMHSALMAREELKTK